MVGGLERYYQIARCYRDEDFRADRQPEFTQLDVEMSFVEQDDVIALGEQILVALWDLIGVTVPTPIPRITFAESMARYGNDKPDLRFGLELVELTSYFSETPFRVFQAPYVGAVVQPGGGSTPRRGFDAWQEWAKQRGAKGLAYVTVGEDGELGGPVAKNLSESERAGLVAAVGASPGDAVFFAAGPVNDARALLGAARLEIGRRGGLIDENEWKFVWVVDAPLFKPTGEDDDVAVGGGAWTAVHHAFTSPDARVDRHVRAGPGRGPGLRVRHRLQRQRDRRRLHPYPPPGRPGAGVRRHGHRRRRGAGEVRLPAQRVPVRRAAARRDRVRLGPHPGAADGLGVDPRRHRVPEVGRRLRPAHGGAGADHARAAPRGRRGRQAEGRPRGLMADVLEVLPPRWRQDRMLLGDRHRWDVVDVLGDDDAILLVIGGPDRPSLLGRGDPVRRRPARRRRRPRARARWMSVPRGARPDRDTLARLGLVPFSTWDFLSTDVLPPTVPGEDAVRALDLDRDADAIRACLHEANPETSADPAGPRRARVVGRGRGRRARRGRRRVRARQVPATRRSWHVHGLGVLPRLRGSGTGTALTAAAVRAGLRSGASWVSLGMYAQNDGARRIYTRLGFRTDAELTSFSPAGDAAPARLTAGASHRRGALDARSTCRRTGRRPPQCVIAKRSETRRRNRGDHQLARPSRVIVAGTRSIRTSVASMSTATAREKPTSLITSSSPATNPANTTMTISAAEVMIRPERCSPSQTAWLFGTPWSTTP